MSTNTDVGRRTLLFGAAGLAALSGAVSSNSATASEQCAPPPPDPRLERLRNDWPYLNRYREENATLLRAGTPVDVVFLGDSITEGWLQAAPKLFKSGRINRGIGGQTTPQMLVRLRPDVIELRPRVVHIMAGINDIAGNTGPATPEMIRANLMSMAQLAMANGITVVLASITPASRFPWREQVVIGSTIADMNHWLAGYAAGIGAVYANYYSALADDKGGMRPGMARDEVHPTPKGYEVMNAVAERAIASALERSKARS